MQATMVAVLAAMLGAAALLARRQERRWAVELKSTPHLTPRLAMRLPKGWTVEESEPGAVPLTVTAVQQAREGGGVVRFVEVVQFPTDVDDGATLLRAYLAGRPGVAGSEQPFSILGRPGALAPFVSYDLGLPEAHAPPVEATEWYAAAVLPTAGREDQGLGLVLRLGGAGAGGRSGRGMLRQVADGLAVRAGNPGGSGAGAGAGR